VFVQNILVFTWCLHRIFSVYMEIFVFAQNILLI